MAGQEYAGLADDEKDRKILRGELKLRGGKVYLGWETLAAEVVAV